MKRIFFLSSIFIFLLLLFSPIQAQTNDVFLIDKDTARARFFAAEAG